MAGNLYVTEFAALEKGNFPLAIQPPLAEQKIAASGSSAASSAFNASTGLVRIHTDAICSIEFGAAPTASASTARMAAGATEYFMVTPGHKVAVINNT